MHTYGTIANSQGMADETNENDAISTVRILVQKVIMSDILNIFSIISNEMPISLLIPCWYFTCLQMYSDKFFSSYSHGDHSFSTFAKFSEKHFF